MHKKSYFVTFVAVCFGMAFGMALCREWSSLASLHPPSGHWSPCGSLDTSRQGALCRCLQHVADCSDRELREIPRFDRPVYKLLFASNWLRSLGNTEIAANITHLDLRNNGIGEILADRLLGEFKNLKVLDIGGNHLEIRRLGGLFTLSSLEELDISGSGSTYKFFQHFVGEEWFPPNARLPNLQVLYMNLRNPSAPWVINMTKFQVFPKLRELEFRGVSRSELCSLKPSFLPNLEKLVLSDHGLDELGSLCSKGRFFSPFFPKLSYLDLSRNNLLSCCGYVCLPEMKKLILDHNPLRKLDIRDNTPSPRRNPDGDMPKLKHLSLKSVGIYLEVIPLDYENFRPLSLDLSQNAKLFMSQKTDRVIGGIFYVFSKLIALNLEGDDLSRMSQASGQSLFAGLRSLRHLNLGNTKLDKVDTVLGQHLNNVTHLFLHDNLIFEIPSGAFDELHELRVLRLDGNQIFWLSQSSFSPNTRARLRSLNLSHNPWQCSCSLLWLRDWASQQPGLFDYHNPYSRYECRNRPGRDVVTFLHNEQPCLLGRDAYVLTVLCAALLMSALTVAGLLYSYRWHIRLALYEAFRGKPEARRPRRGGGDLQYDLFVSYDSEDSHWVLYTLLPCLEQQMGLRVCVHQRDFIPGKNIVDNILHCLDASKRVLAVFSPSFADSHWCHFELEMCLSHVIDSNDVMVVVMLRHVPSRDMSGAMLALINTTTYIEWGDHPDVRESFWRRMTLALKDVLPGGRQT